MESAMGCCERKQTIKSMKSHMITNVDSPHDELPPIARETWSVRIGRANWTIRTEPLVH